MTTGKTCNFPGQTTRYRHFFEMCGREYLMFRMAAQRNPKTYMQYHEKLNTPKKITIMNNMGKIERKSFHAQELKCFFHIDAIYNTDWQAIGVVNYYLFHSFH